MELIAELIRDEVKVNKAKSLLYDYYVTELNWHILPNNPSGIKIVNLDNNSKLTDDYDSHSIWFAINYGDDLLACARLCGRDFNGLMEIERYPGALNVLKPVFDLKDKLNLIELNREAFLANHPKSKKAGLLLLSLIFKFCLKRNSSIITTSNLNDWVSIYHEINFPKLVSCQFKYADFEDHPVETFLAQKEDLARMICETDFLIKKDMENNFKILCAV